MNYSTPTLTFRALYLLRMKELNRLRHLRSIRIPSRSRAKHSGKTFHHDVAKHFWRGTQGEDFTIPKGLRDKAKP